MATAIDIADAVAAALNAETWSQEFTAVREYVPVWDQLDLATLHVGVVPRSTTSVRETRVLTQHTYEVSVTVAKKVEDTVNATIDPLTALAEEVGDYWRENHTLTLSGGRKATCLSVQVEPIFAQELLDENRHFLSVINLTFKVWR